MENIRDYLPFENIHREIIVKRQSKTDPKFGCVPEKRAVAELIELGIINLDKPKGPTSHQVSSYVQQILGINKSGHSGTLDPGVTGVLPIALGRATRITQTILTAGKEYVCLMHLHQPVEETRLREALKEFVGEIEQLPPKRSAVKRRLRQRNIYYIEVLDIKEKDILLKVGCQAGTYIRKLVHDFGKKIGTGAHMAELRRTKAGPFTEETIVTLQDLADAYHYFKEENNDKFIRKCILPVEAAVKQIPKVYIADSAVDSLCHGADLNLPGISLFETGIEKNMPVAVMSLKGELVCLGVSLLSSDEMTAERGLAIKTTKVFMQPGTYPKLPRQ